MKRRFNVNRGAADRRHAHGGTVVYGVHAVTARLATTPVQVQHLYVREGPQERLVLLTADAARRGVPVSQLTAPALQDLCGTDHHQGVAARVWPYQYVGFEEVLGDPPPERVLVIDHLQDPQNLGALLRTAEAAGGDVVVIPKDGAVGITAAVEKAAAGAAVRVPIARVVNVARALRHLKGLGYWIVGLAPHAATDLYQFRPSPRTGLVLGGEAGLRRLVEAECDTLVAIPMRGHTESLNVSVAGALAMYELWCRPPGGPHVV